MLELESCCDHVAVRSARVYGSSTVTVSDEDGTSTLNFDTDGSVQDDGFTLRLYRVNTQLADCEMPSAPTNIQGRPPNTHTYTHAHTNARTFTRVRKSFQAPFVSFF